MAGTVVTTTSTIAAEVRQSYDLKLLLAARPLLVHAQFFDPHPIPKGQGKTINLRRWELLTAATTPLTEGVTPSGSSLTITNIPLSINQYGDFIALSDVVTWVSIDPMVANTVGLQGQQAGNTIDQLSRDVAVTGTNVRYAGGATSRITVAAGYIINGTEIKKCVRTLENGNAMRRGQYFVAIVHPNTSYDIMSASEWINAREYADPKDLYNGELGMLYGVRFVQTTNAKIFPGAGAAGIDVYATLFLGQGPLGATEISGEAMQTIQKPLGTTGLDPLDQRQYTGWKATWGGGIQNDAFMVRLEHAVSA